MDTGFANDRHLAARPLRPGADAPADLWSDWVLRRRHGGDAGHEPRVRACLDEVCDRVLDGARLAPGMLLVDVGTGDGLVAFGALERAGQSLSVVLADISLPLLAHTEAHASRLGLRERCAFLHTSAEALAGVAEGSVDVVTTRAVLAYVRDKALAIARFFEVLKRGGRVSIAEPIVQDDALQLAALTTSLLSRPADATTEWACLMQRCRALQMPSTPEAIRGNPLTNFTERDLVRLFQRAGFVEIHMELHIDARKAEAMAWNTFIDIAPMPGTPTLREVLADHLSEAERKLFEAGLRPVIESGDHTSQQAIAYLTARKP